MIRVGNKPIGEIKKFTPRDGMSLGSVSAIGCAYQAEMYESMDLRLRESWQCKCIGCTKPRKLLDGVSCQLGQEHGPDYSMCRQCLGRIGSQSFGKGPLVERKARARKAHCSNDCGQQI